jgi:probable HAF family extracellular repeat protein
MKSRNSIMAMTVTVARITLTCISAMTSFVLLATPMLAAQSQQGGHDRYRVVVLGTFGGPNDQGSTNGPGNYLINEPGMVTGSADTATPDPFSPNLCFAPPDCFVSHVFRYEKGNLTDLGALVPGFSSGTSQINARGWIVGQSQNGVIDPLTGGYEIRAVLWKSDQIIDLGTLGGNFSLATTLNNAGQVVGAAANTTLDPLSLFGFGTETRAFLWQDGVIEDLGTLGGPDAAALAVNESGQVAGFSYTDATPTPVGMATTHPFLWRNGTMTDLGTLGGTFGGPGSNLNMDTTLAMNNRGQVVGASTLAGDLVAHPFLWDDGVLRDLGTLGGDNGSANWINDAGDVVGEADLPGNIVHHAFLWRNGAMTDLGTLGSTSFAGAINSGGQIVGRSRIGAPTSPLQHAFLWEHGGPMIDLNTLIPANSDLLLTDACCINEGGEIVATGTLASGDVRTILLIPCGEGPEAGDDATEGLATTHDNLMPPLNRSTMSTIPRTPSRTVATWRSRLALRYKLPGVRTPRD